jgi:PKD repeat protein
MNKNSRIYVHLHPEDPVSCNKAMKKAPFFFILFGLFIIPGMTHAQDWKAGKPVVMTPVYFDVSPPLRDLVKQAPSHADNSWKDGIVKNHFNVIRHQPGAGDSAGFTDQAVQGFQGAMQPLAPIQNFEGLNNYYGYVPPDTHGDVGPNHYFQATNVQFAIYNKSGTKLYGPYDNSTIWTGMSNNSNDGDAVVLYDAQADRWLFSQFSLPSYPNGPFYMMIAVSQTPDPTLSWYRYQYTFTDMPDYPKFGVWRDAYYMSCNRFLSGTGTYNGTSAIAIDRSAMLAGSSSPSAVMFSFPNTDEAWTLLPADCDGPFPPAGTPGYFMYVSDDYPNYINYHLGIYELHADWVTPLNSTLGNYTSLPITAYGTSTAGVPQPGTARVLDPIDDRLMYRLQYRVFGDHASMVTNHTVIAGTTRGIRWYELRNSGSSWSIYQQSTYAPADTRYRWMGSIAMDQNGAIALGYSVSSGTVYPSIYYTGRLASDALNTMTQTEAVIIAGGGSQTNTLTSPGRWGDYSAMSVDPSQCGVFWYTQEYFQTTSAVGWQTRIASFQFPLGTYAADFIADNTTPLLTDAVLFTDLTTGCPTGWSWSFTPNTVTYVNGTTSSSQNPQVRFNAAGIYNVSMTATKGGTPSTKTRTAYIYAGTPGLWEGRTSTDWSTASNWNNYIVPATSMPITIPSTATYWPLIPGDLTVGTSCNSITMNGASSQLNVNGNLTINPGYSITVTGSGLIHVGGNWNNYGTFTPGTGTVEFNTATTGKITGGVNPVPIMSNYYRNTFAVGMTALSGGTSLTPMSDDASFVINIGFTFTYMGVNYTQILACSNGWASLNQSGGTATDNAYLFTATAPNTTLAPWFDDLGIGTGGNKGTMDYKIDGFAPNRIFTVEWLNWRPYYTGANTSRLNFQLKLYETTNVIEFQYGTITNSGHNPLEGASIGIEDATGGSGHFIEATTGSMTTGVTTLKSQTMWPGVNYRFGVSPLGTENFYNVIVNKAGGSFTIDRNLNVAGDMTVKP